MSYKAWYNQDADYNTNARSYMDYLARHNKFMKVLVEDYEVFKELLTEEFKQFQLNTDETIDSFQERLDNIKQEMTDFFIAWLEDGTLEEIINVNIFNMKADQTALDETNELLSKTLKVIFPTGGDDSELVTNALNTYDRVMLAGGLFKLNIEINMSDKELFSRKAKITPINNQTHPVIIRGNRNHIHDLDIETSGSRNGLHVEGNFNKIERVKAYALEKYSLGSALSYSPLVLVWGNHNLIDHCEAFNGGCGFTFQQGEYNTLSNSHSHDNTMGVRNAGSSRYPKIINNTIKNNDVSDVTGADGLLIHRNVVGAIVKGNHISYSGEHGIYSQGDNVIIENNIVHNNARVGIKGGAHQTQLHDFNGELYVSHRNIIKDNISHSNGTDGIYYQTPFEFITIENNEVYNNGDEGIKTVAMGQSENDVLGQLIIKNNKTDSLWITGNENTVIESNTIKGRLYTDSKGTDSSLRMINPLIKNNVGETFSLGRLLNGRIIGNIVKKSFIVQDSGKCYLADNEITSENNIDCRNLDVWVNNRVIFKNGCHFERFSGVRKAINNYFESLDLLSGIYLLATNWDKGSRLMLINNHLNVNVSGLFFETFCNNALINGNLFEGSNPLETSIRLRGENAIVTNNTSTNNAKVNFHSNGVGKNNVLSFVNAPGSQHLIGDNW